MNLKERLEKLEKEKESEKVKKRKFRLPRKGKVSKRKMRQGYITLVVMNENRNIDFRKEKLEGGSYKLDDTWHALKDSDVFFYKNKPIVLQPKHRKNPWNPFKLKNNVYGQKRIMARMMNDQIKVKRKMGGAIIWIILAIVVFYIISKGI